MPTYPPVALTTIEIAKEQSISYQPLLLATITFKDSIASPTILRLSTHPVNATRGFQYAGQNYDDRLLNQDLAAIQAMSEQGIDFPSQVSIHINDADGSIWTNYEKAIGFKGAILELKLVFWNVGTSTFSSNSKIKFVGICDPVADMTETVVTVTARNRLNMGHILVTDVPVSVLCPWPFPQTSDQRKQTNDPASAFFRCGYDPNNEAGGGARGSLNAGVPFTSCDYSKAACVARGMYATPIFAFGGVQWDPPGSWAGRAYLSGKREEGENNPNVAKWRDYFPRIYGQGWVDGIVTNVLGDANSTRMEVAVCLGEVGNAGVQRVVVNDTEVPHNPRDPQAAAAGTQQPDPLFRWQYVTLGARAGAPNADAPYNSTGDPYGSIAVILVVVPRKLADSNAVPRVRVLGTGPKVRVYTDATTFTETTFDSTIGIDKYLSPVWPIMDLLVKVGPFTYADLDIATFVTAAGKCTPAVTYTDPYGVSTTHPRFSSSIVLRQRRSLAEIITGLRLSANLILFWNPDTNKLQMLMEQTLADQQPTAFTGESNDVTAYASITAAGSALDGFVAYHFDEATILKEGEPGREVSTLRFQQQPISQTPNRYGFAFQNSDRFFVTDAINLVDPDDVYRAGQEIGASFQVDGINNFDQARRVLNNRLARNYRGNSRSSGTYGDTGGSWGWTFKTTIRAEHLRVGHIISLSSVKYGLVKVLHRIIRIQGSTNMETLTLTCVYHNDNWYRDSYGQGPDPRFSLQARNRLDRPPFGWKPYGGVKVVGSTGGDAIYPQEQWWFNLSQQYRLSGDGMIASVLINAHLPVNTASAKAPPPRIPKQSTVGAGTIPAGDYFIAFASVDSDGRISFLQPPGDECRASLPAANSIIVGAASDPISWPTDAVSGIVFAGANPSALEWQAAIGVPTSYELTALTGGSSSSAYPMPDVEFDRVRVKVKKCGHAGVFGAQVSALTSTTITIAGANFTTNQWAGYDLLLIGRPDTEAPLNKVVFRIASNTATVLTVASGNPSAHLVVNDVVVMLSKATLSTSGQDHVLTDAEWANSFGPEGSSVEIADATNATPIVVSTNDPHGLTNGQNVNVRNCTGNTAANGAWVFTKIDNFSGSLDTSVGNGPYTGGGTIAPSTGLTTDAEQGQQCRVIAGKGVGQSKRIKSNTGTAITLDGKFGVELDSTSRYIIEDPETQTVFETRSLDFSQPQNSHDILAGIANYNKQTIVVEVVLMDGGGNESFDQDNPWRILYVFGASAADVLLDEGYAAMAVTAGAVTPNLDVAVNHRVTMAENLTVNAPIGTFSPGQRLSLKFVQDATGGRTLTWNAAYIGLADVSPELAGDKYNLFNFTYNDSTKWELQSTHLGGSIT